MCQHIASMPGSSLVSFLVGGVLPQLEKEIGRTTVRKINLQPSVGVHQPRNHSSKIKIKSKSWHEQRGFQQRRCFLLDDVASSLT